MASSPPHAQTTSRPRRRCALRRAAAAPAEVILRLGCGWYTAGGVTADREAATRFPSAAEAMAFADRWLDVAAAPVAEPAVQPAA